MWHNRFCWLRGRQTKLERSSQELSTSSDLHLALGNKGEIDADHANPDATVNVCVRGRRQLCSPSICSRDDSKIYERCSTAGPDALPALRGQNSHAGLEQNYRTRAPDGQKSLRFFSFVMTIQHHSTMSTWLRANSASLGYRLRIASCRGAHQITWW